MVQFSTPHASSSTHYREYAVEHGNYAAATSTQGASSTQTSDSSSNDSSDNNGSNESGSSNSGSSNDGGNNNVVSSSSYNNNANNAVVTSSSYNGEATSTIYSSASSSGNADNGGNGASGDKGQGAHTLSLAGVICVAVFGTLFVVSVLFGCCWLRKRRRARATRRGGGLSEKGAEGGYEFDINGPRLSARDLRGVLIPTVPAPAPAAIITPSRQSPSSNLFSPFADLSAVPAVDPFAATNASAIAGPSRRLYPPRPRERVQSVAESSWTDHTEFDMLAVDGSSYARTLSTYSEDANSEYDERDIVSGTAGLSASGAGSSQGTGTYTSFPSSSTQYSAPRPQLELDIKHPHGLTSSTASSSNTHDWIATPLARADTSSSGIRSASTTPYPSFNALRSATSPFSDPSTTHLLGSRRAARDSPEPSWTPEDDQLLLAAATSAANAADTRPTGLQRNVTIIRHQDAGAVNSRPEIRDTEEEVHLPPTYGELYPQRN